VTPDIAATISRSLSALISGQSLTPSIQANIARNLLANIQGTSITPDDLILTLAGVAVITGEIPKHKHQLVYNPKAPWGQRIRLRKIW